MIPEHLECPFVTEILGTPARVERVDLNDAEEIIAVCRRGGRGRRGGRSVRKNVGGVVPRFTISGRRAGVSMRARYGGKSGSERVLFVVGCDRSIIGWDRDINVRLSVLVA